jgi:hypothetical protein
MQTKAVNLSPLGADLNSWLYQAAEEGRDVQTLQERVNSACSTTFDSVAPAMDALLDLSDEFKRVGFADESEPLTLIAEQIDVLATALLPSDTPVTAPSVEDDVIATLEARLDQFQSEWVQVGGEAEDEEDSDIREARKRSLEELEVVLRDKTVETIGLLNEVRAAKRQKIESPAAEAASAPAEEPLKQ